MPRVLVACEMSGRVRTAFAKRGWDAWSADLLPDEFYLWNNGEGYLENSQHYQGDVRDILHEDWDLVIVHPPCTDLSLAGARYWKQKRADGRQQRAVQFFIQMLNNPPQKAYVVVENPVGFMSQALREPDQIVEPWWFGDPIKKKTCLWYRGSFGTKYTGMHTNATVDFLPHLVADRPVEPTMRGVTGGGSWRTDAANGKTKMNNWEDSQGRARRHILRSLTPEGFARAAAEQWGRYIEARLS